MTLPKINLNTVKTLFILLFLIDYLSAGCQTVSSKFVIPLDLSTKRPVVELSINGKGPYKFIFDTGSSDNIVDPVIVKELGLDIIRQDTIRTPGSERYLISENVKANEVSFQNNALFKDVEMHTMDIKRMVAVDGIISPKIFEEYLIEIDYSNNQLILTKDKLEKNDKGVIPLAEGSLAIGFKINVAGKDMDAHLDSGNPGLFDLPYSFKNNLNFKEGPEESGVVQTPVASFKKYKATLAGTIRVGTLKFENPQIHLLERVQLANLGYQFFNASKIYIDKKNGLIKFEPSGNKQLAENKQNETNHDGNEFSGFYGSRERRVFTENGQLFLQRGNAPKIKLMPLENGLYKMDLNLPVANELPNVRFERDSVNMITGLTFIHSDGKKEFLEKLK